MPQAKRIIEVWADWVGLGQPARLGSLTATPARGKEMADARADLLKWMFGQTFVILAVLAALHFAK